MRSNSLKAERRWPLVSVAMDHRSTLRPALCGRLDVCSLLHYSIYYSMRAINTAYDMFSTLVGNDMILRVVYKQTVRSYPQNLTSTRGFESGRSVIQSASTSVQVSCEIGHSLGCQCEWQLSHRVRIHKSRGCDPVIQVELLESRKNQQITLNPIIIHFCLI